MESIDQFAIRTRPTASRPLLGLTILIVEDSRYASEMLRLLCLRSGARIRRADSLQHAYRHLQVYRPSVVMIDLGLPDGNGESLIAELATASPRVSVILGMSGDPDAYDVSIKSGADGFLEKPITSIGAFQSKILSHLPRDWQPKGPTPANTEEIGLDEIALRDDLTSAAMVLEDVPHSKRLGYVTHFLHGIAKAASDHVLITAVDELEGKRRAGQAVTSQVAIVSALLHERITDSPKL